MDEGVHEAFRMMLVNMLVFLLSLIAFPFCWEKSKDDWNQANIPKVWCWYTLISNAQRFRILSSLIMVGFRRIGIGSNFIHVDAGYPNLEPLFDYWYGSTFRSYFASN